VLYLLLEEMTDQHIKEVLLAFVILMQSGAPVEIIIQMLRI
jgi:hypothetical protein